MSGSSPGAPAWKAVAVQHMNRARDNYQLYQKLASEGAHLDWAVTVLFYTALHLVQACLVNMATDPFQIPREHDNRRYQIGAKLSAIFTDYRFLEDMSRRLRYYPDRPHPTPTELQRYESERFSRIVAEMQARGVSLSP